MVGAIWPEEILGLADFIGRGLCHQLPEHSYTINGRQFPLCARCAGIYLGSTVGLAGLWMLGREGAANLPRPSILGVLALFILAMGLDGLNSYLSLFPEGPLLYPPRNILRLLTGTLHGLALSAIVLPIFNFTLWQNTPTVRSVENLAELAFLSALTILFSLALPSGISLLLIPLALITTLGILLTLTAINTMILVVATRREGGFTSGRAALPFIAGGVALALGEVGGLSLMRLLLGIFVLPTC